MSDCEYILDSIPAFVLGALDNGEAARVAAHVAGCSACRGEADSFRSVVGLMPYSAGALDPPPRVKQQLLARIAAATNEPAAPTTQPARPLPTPRAAQAERWTRPALAFSLVLALAFGGVALDARQRADQLAADLEAQRQALSIAEANLAQVRQAESSAAAQLATSQQELADVAARLVESQREVLALQQNTQQGEQLVSFIAAPQTVSQPLGTTVRAPQEASARMFMQPGHNRLVLLIYGLDSAEPGKVYRLWLAKESQALAVGTLKVNADGVAEVALDAPEPMDSYDQVMITLDEDDTAAAPSDEIIFEAEL